MGRVGTREVDNGRDLRRPGFVRKGRPRLGCRVRPPFFLLYGCLDRRDREDVEGVRKVEVNDPTNR